MTITEYQPEAVPGELLPDTATLLRAARDHLHDAEGHGSALVGSLWHAGRALRDAKAQAARDGQPWGALLDGWGIDNRRASEAMRVSQLPEADLPQLATVRLALAAAKTDRRTAAAVPDASGTPEPDPEPKLTRAEEQAQEREAELAHKSQLVTRLTDRVGSLEAENQHLRETSPEDGKAQATSIVETQRQQLATLTATNRQQADEIADLKRHRDRQTAMLRRKDAEIAALRERAETAETKLRAIPDASGTAEHAQPSAADVWGVAQQ